jgi:chemotaxis protein CheC
MFDLNNVNQTSLDFFREIENIGAGHAATALSMMMDRQITVSVPRAQLCSYNEITEILNGPENVVVGLLVGISDDLHGFILLVLDLEDARTLVSTLLGEPISQVSEDGAFNEMQLSVLREVANILIGSYITAISELTGLRIDASVPELVIDMAGAVMNLLAAAYGAYGDHALFLETRFADQAQCLYGHFFLIPDIKSYQTLLRKMGIS